MLSTPSVDRKVKRSKRKRKEESPQLNIYESIPNITDLSFPWISLNDPIPAQQTEDAWPYISFPKVKSEKYRTYTEEAIYGIGVQTDLKKRSANLIFSNSKILASEENLNNRHDFTKLIVDDDQAISLKRKFSSPIIKKKVQQQATVGSNDNFLPKYISDFAPYGYTPLPEWLKNVIPSSINQDTVLQAGKPWHSLNKCTWANELNYLSTEPNFKRTFIRKSPTLNWGESVCSLQHRQFLISYGRNAVKRRYSLFNQQELKREKSESRAHSFGHLQSKLLNNDRVHEDIVHLREVITGDPENPESPAEVIPETKPTKEVNAPLFSQDKFLTDLSYNPSQMKKKPLIRKPTVKNFDPPWSLAVSPCKWPKFVSKSIFFKSLVKKEPLRLVVVGKCRENEQWPYSPNMVKVRRHSEKRISPIFEIKADMNKFRKPSDVKLRRDSRRSRSRINVSDVSSVKTDYSKKRRSTMNETMNIPSEDSKKKTMSTKKSVEDEIQAFPRPPYLNEYVHEEIVEECILAEQNKFPGFVVTQPVNIQPHSYPAPFKYQYSNLSYFEKNYSHFLHGKKTSQIAYYFAKPFIAFGDLFDGKTNLAYFNKNKFVENILESNVGNLYYPNGKLAICCKNDLIGAYSIRRYVIFDNNPKKYLILGIFDSLGNGILYDKKGKIRLNYSQNFGTLFDTKYGVVKWRWHNIPLPQAHKVKHSDSLPKTGQPETEMEEMRARGVNLLKNYTHTMKGHLTESNPILSIDEAMISDTATKLKNKKIKTGYFTKMAPFQLKINANMLLKVRDQKHVTLWFQGDEHKAKIEMGIVLDPAIRLREVEMDARSVLRQQIPLEFEKIVGNTDSLLRILGNVGDGSKLEPYFEPCDQLINPDTHYSIIYDVPPPTQLSESIKEAGDADDGVYQMIDSVTFSEEKLLRKKYHGSKFTRHETRHVPSAISEQRAISHDILPHTRDTAVSKTDGYQLGKSSEFEPAKPHIVQSSIPIYMNVTEMIGNEELWKKFIEAKKNPEKINVEMAGNIRGRLLSKRSSTPFIYYGE